MASVMRTFGKIANKVSDIETVLGVDSAEIIRLADTIAIDSADIISAIDSDYIVLKQNKTFGILTNTPTTLSGYGITDTESSGALQIIFDSDKTSVIGGAPSVLNTLNKLSDAINDDSTAYTSLTAFVNGLGDSANNGGWGGN